MSLTQTQLALIALAVIGIVVSILLVYIVRQEKKRKNRMGYIHKNRGSGRRNGLYWLYRFYVSVPGFNRYFDKFRTRIATLYPADQIEVNRKATETMAGASAGCIAAGIAMIALARSDVFFLVISLVTVYILFTDAVSRAIGSMETKLLRDFADFLTDVRSNYHNTGMVDDAIFLSLDNLPYAMALHASRIYEIVTSTRISEKVEEYTDAAPNRFFEMFAAVCATIQEYGDKKLENGESLFLKNLNYIKEEVYVEITRREKNAYAFRSLTVIAVVPVFCMKLIQMWAQSISDLSQFYKGSAGMVIVFAAFAATLLSCEMIANLRDGRAREVSEHPFLEKLAKAPFFEKPLTAAVNHNYTKAMRIGDENKITGDHISPQAFLLKRLLIGLALGLVTLFVMTSSVVRSRRQILNDYSEAFQDSIVADEASRENIRQLTKDYVIANRQINAYSENDIKAIQQDFENMGVSENLAVEMANEVSIRNDKYAHAYFRFWYLFIVAAAAVVGYYAPVWLLKYRISIMRMSMADEVAQFQTLALILMNVDGMTIDVILEWMERFAFVFRQSISECILNLSASENKALRKMKDSECYPPFLRFCDNLISIDNVGVRNAFDEVATEQENYKQQRNLNNEIEMQKKSSIGKFIAYLPAVIVVAAYLIFPFVKYAFEMMQNMTSALGA